MKRALVIIAMISASARGDSPDRVAYVANLLDAIQASDRAARTATSDYIYTVDRNKCQAPVESLHVGCLIEAAARNCATQEHREHCERLSDVIVTNRLSEPHFVSKDMRYQIMEKHKDYRVALERELRRRYAILVSELAMSHYFPGSAASNQALATGIDGYCRELAGLRDVSWQYCVSGIVWFIGTEEASR